MLRMERYGKVTAFALCIGAAGLVACGGGGSTTPAAAPAPTPTPAPASLTTVLPASATTIALPALGRLTGQLLAPRSSQQSLVNLTIDASVAPQAQFASASTSLLPGLSGTRAPKSVTIPNCGTVIAYYSIIPSAPATFQAAPALLINVPSSATGYAAAFFAPGATSAVCAAPTAQTASTVLFTDPVTPVSITPSQPLIVVVYGNSTVTPVPSTTPAPSTSSSPTPSPAASSAASATPTPTPTPTPSPVPTSATNFNVT